jgi:hypothetical protein
MTHYDALIDAIKQQLYEHHCNTAVWNENEANETSHRILKIVEEFQETRSGLKKYYFQWRASD